MKDSFFKAGFATKLFLKPQRVLTGQELLALKRFVMSSISMPQRAFQTCPSKKR